MAVRCKFKLTNRAESVHTDSGVSFTFSAVNRHDVSNEQQIAEDSVFGKWTPDGRIEVTIKNPDAIKQFQIGKSYYVDFEPAEG